MEFGENKYHSPPRRLHQRSPAVIVPAVHRGSLPEQKADQVLVAAGRGELQGGVPLLVRAVHRNQRQHDRGAALRQRFWPQPALPPRLLRSPGFEDAASRLIVALVTGTEKQQRIRRDTETHDFFFFFGVIPSPLLCCSFHPQSKSFSCQSAAACVEKSWRTVKIKFNIRFDESPLLPFFPPINVPFLHQRVILFLFRNPSVFIRTGEEYLLQQNNSLATCSTGSAPVPLLLFCRSCENPKTSVLTFKTKFAKWVRRGCLSKQQ